MHDFNNLTSIAAYNAKETSGYLYAVESEGTPITGTGSRPGGQPISRFIPTVGSWPAGSWASTGFGGAQVTSDNVAAEVYVLDSAGNVWFVSTDSTPELNTFWEINPIIP